MPQTYYSAHREHLRKYQRRYYREHPEQKREMRRRRALKQAEYYEQWYRTNGRKRAPDYVKKAMDYRKAHPEIDRVRHKVAYAIKTGRIEKPLICEKCGRKKRLHAHHIDYNQWNNVVFLCASCHKKEHLK